MIFHFYSFLAGAAFCLAYQWVCMIPFMRRHRVVRALLNRAKMYQQRGEKLSEEGKQEEAVIAWAECKLLLAQVDQINEGKKK